MKKHSRLLAILVCVMMITALAACFTVSASASQYVSSTLYIDGKEYTNSIPGVSFKSGVLTLDNANIGSVAYIADGMPDPWADEEYAPLYIELKGTSTVSSGYFVQGWAYGETKPSSSSAWIGNIYCDGEVVIKSTADGILNLNCSPSGSSNNIISVDATYVSVQSGTVNINAKPKGVTDNKAVIGINSPLVITDTGSVRINVGADTRAVTKPITSIIQSKAEVTGITGATTVNTKGMLSVNIVSQNTGSSICTRDTFTATSATAIYLQKKTAGKFSNFAEPISYSASFNNYAEASLDGVDYISLTPKTSTTLKPIDWNAVLNAYEYPKYGDAKTADDTVYKKSEKGDMLYKTSTYKLPYGMGAGMTSAFETYAGSYYAFRFNVVPMEGYYVTTPTLSDVKYPTSAAASITSNNKTVYTDLYYSYYELKVTKQPTAYLCGVEEYNKGTVSLDIAASLSGAGVKYEWQIDEMYDGGVMSGDINSWLYEDAFSGEATNRLSIDTMELDRSFQSIGDQDFLGVQLCCTVTAMPSGQTAESDPCYYSIGHYSGYKPVSTGGTTHESKCLDEACGKVFLSEDHVDVNLDGVCDKCSQSGLIFIKEQTTAVETATNEKVTFKVDAGGHAIGYEWHYINKGTDKILAGPGITGTNSPEVTLDPTAVPTNNMCSWNGIELYCIMKNVYGTLTSEKAELTVYHAADKIDEVNDETHSFTCYCGEKLGAVLHSFADWTQTVDPTCATEGQKITSCTICGKSKTEAIEKLSHDIVIDTAVAATCTETGFTEGEHCTNCDYKKEQTVVPASGHDTVKDVAVAATCTKEGKTEGKHCTRCDYKKEGTTVAKLGHSYKDKLTKATTSKAGKIESVCERCGTKKAAYTVIPQIKTCTLSYSYASYTGSAKKPAVTVKDSNGNKLKKDTDYTVTYSNNTAIGKASVKITFKGNYSGSKTLNFTIRPANVTDVKFTSTTSSVKLSWTAVKGAATYRIYKYSSTTKKYTQVASTSKTEYTFSKLSKGTVYSYYIKASKNVSGTTYISSTYVKIKTATKTSAPSTPTLTAGSKKITAKWSKVTGATGYQFAYATSKTGTYKTVSTTKLTCTKTGLTSGKTYYVKVRTYKTVDGVKVYSSYSAPKSVKVK